MSTTTLRVPDTLRARIARLAEESEQTQHGLMLDLLARGVEERELRAAFHREGKERLLEMIASGMVIPWEEMRAYMLARAKAISQGSRGDDIKKPKARKWRKSS